MSDQRGRYGVDAPTVPAVFAVVVLVSGAGVGVALATGDSAGSAVGPAIPLMMFALFLGSYLYATRRGKFVVWEKLLDQAVLRPEARVLDLGCGRGAVLLAAARRLGADGRAEGIDLWRGIDQSGSSCEVTLVNAQAEGVAERVELHTGDLRALRFEDASFDVVLSSLAIHNIKPEADREQSARQALRVLRPGGQLTMVDLPAGKGYLQLLERELEDATLRGVGWRMWWGGPFYASSARTGTDYGCDYEVIEKFADHRENPQYQGG